MWESLGAVAASRVNYCAFDLQMLHVQRLRAVRTEHFLAIEYIHVNGLASSFQLVSRLGCQSSIFEKKKTSPGMVLSWMLKC